MKNKKKISNLDFSSEKQTKQKQLRSFIIAFASFVIILGTVSMFAFMKSVDFNLNNLIQNTTDTTAGSTENTETTIAQLTGRSDFILIFTDESGALTGVSALDCNMDAKNISVLQLAVNENDDYGSAVAAYNKGGAAELLKYVSSVSGLSFDKYIKVNPTQLKKIVAKTGDVTVHIPETINYKGTDFTLLLDAGKQNLTSDLFYKYFCYADLSGKANAVTALVNSLLSVKNLSSQDTFFNFIMNNSDTDISIVDYTKISGVLSSYIQYSDGNAAVSVNDFSMIAEATKNEK